MTLSLGTLVLFVHILAAMVLVGSSLFAPLLRRAAQAATSAGELRGWLELGRRAAGANPAAALLLLGTGIYLGKDGWWSYGWFWAAVSAWLCNTLLAALVVRRSAVALAVAAFRSGQDALSVEVDRLRRSRAWETAEGVMAANDITLLYVMLDKPTLVQSVALLVAANLAFFGVRLAREWRGGRGQVPAGSHLGALSAPAPSRS